MSLRALRAVARTFLEAGLPLMIMASPVKGFLPGRSLVAGFFTALSLSRPGITNSPGPREPSCFLITSPRDSKTREMLFLSSSVSSASSAITCDLVNRLVAIVFLLKGEQKSLPAGALGGGREARCTSNADLAPLT